MPLANTQWREELIIECFKMAQQGFSESKMIKTIGCSPTTFRHWKKTKAVFKKALEDGKKKPEHLPAFHDYVFQRLPEDLQEVWENIMDFDSPDTPKEWIRNLLKDKGELAKKQLFIFALTKYNFNPSEALRQIGLSKWYLDKWIDEDKDFAAIVDELHWHKKNFFESHLIALVRTGNPHAIIFVNKCFNRDRGYSEQMEVKVTHQQQLDLASLDLPIETQRQVLEAMRKKQRGDTDPTAEESFDMPVQQIEAAQDEDEDWLD